jgi:hypothetical protein
MAHCHPINQLLGVKHFVKVVHSHSWGNSNAAEEQDVNVV